MNTKTYNKFLAIFKSRKFWACFLAVLTAVGAYMYGDLDLWEMVQAVVAAAAAYATGVAIEDAGTNISGTKLL
jgi:phage-related holin